jgi:translation initiation factor IF-3
MSERPRINEQIRVSSVRLIDQNGESLGILATSEALEIARKAGLDLVEIDARPSPPVCRVMDFGKAEYERLKSQRRNSP